MDASMLKSEFAAVEVDVDEEANGPRLRIEDLKTGRVGYLDALELETLAWLPERALHPLLDPSALRWGEQPPQPPIAELVKQVYSALAGGDRDKLLELLAEDFEAKFAAGMPVVDTSRPIPSGEDMIDRCWWPLGRAFQVRVEPSEWIPCAGGRLLVVGRYRGAARSTGNAFEANLVHLWTARDGKLTHLWHLTDTAAWAAALEQ
jgi:2-(1,2-epoxy-1,2-dihydrophenyl)acetyl-CoA isomerase